MCAEDRPGTVGKGDTKILTFRKTKEGFPVASLVDCKTSKLNIAVTSGGVRARPEKPQNVWHDL